MAKKDRLRNNHYIILTNKIEERAKDNKLLYNYLSEHFNKINNFKEQPLKLAVIGRFNSGKTTFINRLLGLSLPVSRTPTTKIITNIRYGEKNKIEIEYKIKSEANSNSVNNEHLSKFFIKEYEFDSFEEMKDKLKEILNNFDKSLENDLIDIEEIRVYTDNNILKDFEIIDTPGLSDPDSRIVELTKRLFEKVNFAIFIFNAAQTGSQDELEILKEFREKSNYEKNIYAFINQADLYSEDDIEKIKKDLKEKFARYFVNDEIMAISCKSKDEKWNLKFEELKSDLRYYILDKDIEIAEKQIEEEFFIIKKKIENLKDTLQTIHKKLSEKLEEIVKHLNFNDEYKMKIKEKMKNIITDNINIIKQQIYEEKKKNPDSVIRFLAFYKTTSQLSHISEQLRSAYTDYIEDIKRYILNNRESITSLLDDGILKDLKSNIEVGLDETNTILEISKINQRLAIEGYINGTLKNNYILNHLNSKNILEDLNTEIIDSIIDTDLDIKHITNKIKHIKDYVDTFFYKTLKDVEMLIEVLKE